MASSSFYPPTNKQTITYKYGASDSAFLDLRPNHILLWTAIRWAAENGYTRVRFRADPIRFLIPPGSERAHHDVAHGATIKDAGLRAKPWLLRLRRLQPTDACPARA